ncbi:MAG: TatD family hydrolase [Pseudomonadota bacterium]|nr:TatD family hydrolase [Pseudomonadota bacterium]
MLIDSHCHLDYPDFDADLDDVIRRARSTGVGRMLTICTRMSGFEKVLGIATHYEGVACSAGHHPHHATEEGTPDTGTLAAAAQHPVVLGIGETGLDYFYDFTPRADQEALFRSHIQASAITNKPLIVHSREAEADTMRILREEGANNKLNGVMHCFSSSRQLAEDALDFGFYISFSGILTFKKSDELRAIAEDVPMERLLIETDAPYLSPAPYRGKRNEPAHLVHTAKILAEIKGVSIDILANYITDNFERLFKTADRSA